MVYRIAAIHPNWFHETYTWWVNEQQQLLHILLFIIEYCKLQCILQSFGLCKMQTTFHDQSNHFASNLRSFRHLLKRIQKMFVWMLITNNRIIVFLTYLFNWCHRRWWINQSEEKCWLKTKIHFESFLILRSSLLEHFDFNDFLHSFCILFVCFLFIFLIFVFCFFFFISFLNNV